MTLIEPITSYDVRRRKASSRTPPPEHVVYFARLGSSGIVKVGYTSNAAGRTRGHRAESGMVARYMAQIIVADRMDAQTLERHVIGYCAKNFRSDRREWFQMTDDEVARVFAYAKSTSPVVVIETRSAAGASETASAFDAVRHEVSSAARQYSSKRGLGAY